MNMNGRRMSYNEMMKVHTTEKQGPKMKAATSLYCQMVLDEAWFKLQKQRLEEAIDGALINRDRKSFMEFSSKYNELMQNW